ncbi:MAG TPA: tetratricopeptide repeat protein [bacterium]|nr:tetratricopeptide repeat protein [bacterium]
MRKGWSLKLIAVGLMGVLLSGCATSNSLMVRDSLLREAESHFSRGEYRLAQLKYSAYLYSPEEPKPQKALALYRLGYCQYIAGHHRDAEKTLSQFVTEFPNDKRRPEAEEWLNSIRGFLEKQAKRSQQQVEKTAQQITSLREQTQQSPNDAEKHFQLGESYWKMGQFDEALKEYDLAVRLNPQYRQNPSVQKRTYIGDDGALKLRESLLTPKTTGPIDIRKVRTRRVETSDFWGTHPTKYSYVVSGEAFHVGDRVCANIQIEVTIYDFFEKVMDSRIVNIGTMQPGQSRHFVAELNRFAGDPLEINRYETQVFYEER